jgi:hypothetical protein
MPKAVPFEWIPVFGIPTFGRLFLTKDPDGTKINF